MDETLGKRLRRLREDAGLSQRDISVPPSKPGVRDGITAAYISRIEKGERSPSVSAIRKIAEKLGVTAAYLEYGQERTETDVIARDVIERLRDGALTITVVSLDDKPFKLMWRRGDDERAVEAETLTEGLRVVLDFERSIDAMIEQALALEVDAAELRARVAAA